MTVCVCKIRASGLVLGVFHIGACTLVYACMCLRMRNARFRGLPWVSSMCVCTIVALCMYACMYVQVYVKRAFPVLYWVNLICMCVCICMYMST